ncbi:MAG TPA: tetratricopeptide repeat protein [Bacillota bacterium]|nr:tetratricopeptide repeat protein [Bacillota bacterium]HPT86964.1 tetratricopeptide repeat protein [Bacillota bacterium]
MTKLSLCMIVKDEADTIGSCLESVRDLVDEMIVVDTGSIDDTPQIAEKLGAKVHHFQWNDDFSEARNYSLQLAQGDWILFLDADEILVPQSKDALRQGITDPEVEGYFIKILNQLDYDNHHEIRADLVFRLFRNRKEYRFQHAIHEQILDSILENNPKAVIRVNENIAIWHTGFREHRIQAKDKRNRNLRLLQRELEKNPDNAMLRYHYGEELFYAKRYAEAIPELRKASAGLDPHTHFVPKLLRALITSHLMLNEYETALQLVKFGILHLPFFADLHYIGGLASLGIGDYSLARTYFNNAINTPDQPVHYASVNGTHSFLSYYQLGIIAEELMEYGEAINEYAKAVRANPNFTPALEKLIALLNPRRAPGETKAKLEALLRDESPLTVLHIGKILFQQSAFGLALEYLEKASKSREFPAEANVWKAVCLFQQGQEEEAAAILRSFTQDHPLFINAAFEQFLNHWLKKDLEQVATFRQTLLNSSLPSDIKQLILILHQLLAKHLSQALPESDETASFTLSPSCSAALSYIFIRALDLSEIELIQHLIKELSMEQLTDISKELGTVFHKYGYFELAADFFKHYWKKHPNSSECYYLLAQTHEEQGRHLEASTYYRLALACNKDAHRPQYYQALIRSYRHLRQQITEKAAQYFPDHPLPVQPSKEV